MAAPRTAFGVMSAIVAGWIASVVGLIAIYGAETLAKRIGASPVVFSGLVALASLMATVAAVRAGWRFGSGARTRTPFRKMTYGPQTSSYDDTSSSESGDYGDVTASDYADFDESWILVDHDLAPLEMSDGDPVRYSSRDEAELALWKRETGGRVVTFGSWRDSVSSSE